MSATGARRTVPILNGAGFKRRAGRGVKNVLRFPTPIGPWNNFNDLLLVLHA